MGDDDSRQDEADFARQEAAGKHHKVTVSMWVQATITLPGSTHKSEDLYDVVDQIWNEGEVTELEEV